MLRHLLIALAFGLAACASEPAFDPGTIPLVLSGEITRADHQTYREIPFDVPYGTGLITIDFAYTGKENRTVIDIGVRDQHGQRGWSGGNKSHIEIGETNATPSYRPGNIEPGEWKLVLGVPNIREGQTAKYTATISFDTAGAGRWPNDYVPDWSTAMVLNTSPGWYRGDLHNHTAHSDGSCDVDDNRAPCPAVETFDAARNAMLDFVAITDHNTITQLADIRRLQDNNPKTLLIPGTEVTTFFGHANVVGNTDFVDFQLGSPRLPTLSKLFDEADAQGAFVSANHPSLPSGEICMGCGWTVKDTDWSRVTSIEVINGGTLRTSGSDVGGIAFWEKLLNQGNRITAIGGSDNHDATDRTGAKQSPVGKPTTIVYADELSTRGIVAGVKSGRVFIDVGGLPDATLDMRAELSSKTNATRQSVPMGGEIKLRPGEEIRLYVSTSNLPEGAKVELASNRDIMRLHGEPYYRLWLEDAQTLGWVHANVRDASGKLLLLGNPIYFTRAAAP